MSNHIESPVPNPEFRISNSQFPVDYSTHLTNHLINYLLHLADDHLILSHRLSEWCGHGPVLEQDIAVTNIALDILGQSRNFYQYAAQLSGGDTTENSLAYLRDVRSYKNSLLAEQPNGDWAVTVLRQFFYSSFRLLYYKELIKSSDAQLAAIAEKAIKEVAYHVKWSSEWVIRLGDGTDESNERINQAYELLCSFTGELFLPADYETAMAEAGIGVHVSMLKTEWVKQVTDVFEEATIPVLSFDGWMQQGGKNGMHTEYLGYILADLQYLQRAYPGSEW